MDIGLPKLNGYQAARQLRQREGYRGTLMIAASGYGRVYDMQMSREVGFDHHLTKPVDPNHLIRLPAPLGRENACRLPEPTVLPQSRRPNVIVRRFAGLPGPE